MNKGKMGLHKTERNEAMCKDMDEDCAFVVLMTFKTLEVVVLDSLVLDSRRIFFA